VKAWVHVRHDEALLGTEGKKGLPLYGVVVGVKDIISTSAFVASTRGGREGIDADGRYERPADRTWIIDLQRLKAWRGRGSGRHAQSGRSYDSRQNSEYRLRLLICPGAFID
jgi:hypothetical protein